MYYFIFQDGMVGYRLPSLERLRNKLLPCTVESTKKILRKLIMSGTSFTVVLDIWSSKSMMGFIGFTLIGVNREFVRFNIFLGVKLMTVRHTAENILAEYDQMLCDWNIPRSLVSHSSNFKNNLNYSGVHFLLFILKF